MPGMKAKVAFEGEKEFRKQIDSLTGGLRLLSSELDKTSAQYAGNDKSVEGLTKKNEVLGRILDAQNDKVTKLTAAHEKAKTALGENDERTQRLAISLNKAETEVIKTQKAMSDNTEAMKEGAKATGELEEKQAGLGDELGKITESFGVSLPSGITKFLNSMDSATAKAALFTTAAVKIVSTMIKASKETAETADETLRLASTTGMSTDQVQIYKLAAEELDVSFETVSGAQTKMIKTMSAARDGTGESAEAYKKLGIDVTGADGKLRDVNDVFLEAIDKLGRMRNETDRDAYSMAIFGKGARELNPILEAGSGTIEDLGKKYKEMGAIMDEEALQKANKLKDAMDQFNVTQKALSQNLGTALIPILTGVFTLLSKIPPDVIKVVVVIAAVVAGVIAVVNIIKSVNDTVGAVTKLMDPANMKMLKTTVIIIGIVGALILLIAAIAAVTGHVKDMERAFDSATGSMGRMSGGNAPRYATGTDFHPGGIAYVGEEGPEAVFLPRGTKVLPHRQSMDLRRNIPAYAGGVGSFGGNVFNITIDARNVREFNDIVRIAETKRVSMRQGTTRRG